MLLLLFGPLVIVLGELLCFGTQHFERALRAVGLYDLYDWLYRATGIVDFVQYLLRAFNRNP